MTMLSEDGFQIGEIYFLKSGNTTQLMPRRQISYVSARYQSRPIYLVIAAIAIIIGLALLRDRSTLSFLQGTPSANETLGILAPFVIGVLLILAFFGSRRVGIVLASSGGRMFVETRGRNRAALLERIHADLSAHHHGAPRSEAVELGPKISGQWH